MASDLTGGAGRKARAMDRPRSGLSLVELIVVLVIVVLVIVGFGASAAKQTKRANRSDVENELNVMAQNLSDAYYDLGNPVFNPGTDQAGFENFLKIVQSEYLGCEFDFDTVTPYANGFTVEIASPKDVFEQRYKCWFITVDTIDRYAMICSGGENTEIESDGYASGNYSDDIVLVVKPKVG